MRKLLAILVALALIMPTVLAIDTGLGLGISISTEKFVPLIWMCDDRKVSDDNVEPGRITDAGDTMSERTQNYAFEGEQIAWDVLVMDKNGVEKIKDVYVSVGETQSNGQFIEANCDLNTERTQKGSNQQEGGLPDECNARISEETLHEFDADTMAYYRCTLTVESPESMHGQYWVAANVVDLDDQTATFDENEFWFFNPTISLTLSGLPLRFGTVRPGTVAYSNTITVGNGAEASSGVMMDMFISGTDFTDPSHSGAKCPTSNVLRLEYLNYYAVSGAYSTHSVNSADDEGYLDIEYGAAFNVPEEFYDRNEVLPAQKVGPYYTANILAPGSEMSVTFKLALPEPCNGDFSDGHIYFWGEAI